MNTTLHHGGQRERILQRLKQGGRVPMPLLQSIGSGKEHGFVASFTRRISEIRKQGYNVVCHRTTTPDGVIQTEYELVEGLP